METSHHNLSPAQARILDAFAAVHFSLPDLLSSLRLSASDFLTWAAAPPVAAALDTLRSAIGAAHDLRLASLRDTALNALAAVLADPPNPIERRRAATTLLNTLDRRPPRSPRATTDPPSPRPTPTPSPLTPSPTSTPMPVPLSHARRTEHPCDHTPNPPASRPADPAPSGPARAPVEPPSILTHSTTTPGRPEPSAPAPAPAEHAASHAAPAPPLQGSPAPSSAPPLHPRRPHSRAASLAARAGAATHPP